MAPRRKRGRRNGDHVTVPLAISSTEGDENNFNLNKIKEAFDLNRPFRIGCCWGKLASFGKRAVPVQLEFYGPTTDTVWTGPLFLAVPNGTSFRYRIPVTATGWYRPEADLNNVWLKVRVIATKKGTVDSGVSGCFNIKVFLRPRENTSASSVILPSSVSAMPAPEEEFTSLNKP